MILNTTIALLILNTTTGIIPNRTVLNSSPHQIVNHSLVIEVTSSVSKLYEFKTFVFFISERLTSERVFEDFWNTFPTSPFLLIVNNTSKMSGFLSTTTTLCLILTTAKDDPIMERAALSMKGSRVMKTIFILYPSSKSCYSSNTSLYEGIRLLYDWIWRKQFQNTLLITIRNNIYIHNPYPTGYIVNKTNNWTAVDFFEDYSRNLKGYQVKTTLHQDLPKLFRVITRQLDHNKVRISGVSGKMFLTFLQQVNATFNNSLTIDDNLNTLNIKELIDLVEKKNLEMGVNTYSDMIPSLIGASYPIGINDFCVMVPYQNSSPERIYMQGPFHTNSWQLLMFSILYITVGIWLCTPWWERDLSLSFLQSICSLLLITPLRFFTLPYLRLRFLFVVLFIMGFFITNMYMSKLASYFTMPTLQQQIDTVDDIVAANLNIMMMDYEYEKLREHGFPQNFLDLIVVVSKSVMDEHRDHFNSSFGYSIQTDHWSFLNRQQVHLLKPLFRMSSICIGRYYHVFPIQRDSHLRKPLDKFILAAQSYGFAIHWEAEAFHDALFMGYTSIIMIELHPVALTMIYFRPIYLVWCFGLILAGFVFALEVRGITPRLVEKCVMKAFHRLQAKLITFQVCAKFFVRNKI